MGDNCTVRYEQYVGEDLNRYENSFIDDEAEEEHAADESDSRDGKKLAAGKGSGKKPRGDTFKMRSEEVDVFGDSDTSGDIKLEKLHNEM